MHNQNISTRSSEKEIIIDMEASWISGFGLDYDQLTIVFSFIEPDLKANK